MNTRDVEDGIEELATPGGARLAARARAARRPRLDARRLERLTELRETLRELLLANNGAPATGGAALERLRAEAARGCC